MNLTDNGLSVDTHRVMKCDADPVVARYSRTMYGSDGAFPKSPEYANPVQSFDGAAEAMLCIALACIASCFGLFVLFGMLPNGVTQ